MQDIRWRVGFSRASGINRSAHIALLGYQAAAQGWLEHTLLLLEVYQKHRFVLLYHQETKETIVGGDENYGEFSQKPDVPQEIYLELKDNFLNNLKVHLSSDLEKETRGQSLS